MYLGPTLAIAVFEAVPGNLHFNLFSGTPDLRTSELEKEPGLLVGYSAKLGVSPQSVEIPLSVSAFLFCKRHSFRFDAKESVLFFSWEFLTWGSWLKGLFPVFMRFSRKIIVQERHVPKPT